MSSKTVMKTVLSAMLVFTFVACGKAKNGGAVRGRAHHGKPATDIDTKKTDSTQTEDEDIIIDDGPGTDKPKAQDGTADDSSDDATSGSASNGETSSSDDSSGGSVSSAGEQATPTSETKVSGDEYQRLLLAATRYTGSAEDGLREALQKKMAANDDEGSRKRNLIAADSVVDAQLVIDRKFKEVLVRIRQKSEGKVDGKITELTGALNSQLEGELIKNQGEQEASGTIRCLDKQAMSCETAHARLALGVEGSRSIVNIIFRVTGIQLQMWAVPHKNSADKTLTAEQAVFDRLAKAKEDHQNGDRIDDERTIMESFEVIQGRSSARIKILTETNQIITVKAPLVDFAVIGKARPIVDVSLKNVKMEDLQTGDHFKGNLQSLIKDARLLANNKKGGLKLILGVGNDESEQLGVVELRVQRISKEIRSNAVSSQ